jgi:uncharacterized protein (DUF1330 family)
MPTHAIHSLEELSDPEAMQEYAANVDKIVAMYDGKFLVPRGEARAIEGSWDPGVVALIEWPSTDRFVEFYESPEYRPWRDLRHRASKNSIVIVSAGEFWGEFHYLRPGAADMRGVIIIKVRDDEIVQSRFYMEEVDDTSLPHPMPGVPGRTAEG